MIPDIDITPPFTAETIGNQITQRALAQHHLDIPCSSFWASLAADRLKPNVVRLVNLKLKKVVVKEKRP